MTKKRYQSVLTTLFVCIGLGVMAACVLAFRGYRTWDMATDMQEQVHYLIENGGTIGEVPAAEAFDVDYLDAIFGANPQLSSQVRQVIQQGLADKPALNLGEVAAMLVTYRQKDDGSISDVVAHVIGGFPLGKRKPQMHVDGYFKEHLEEETWRVGNTFVGFVGRDMILFGDEAAISTQEAIIESIFDGEIMPLVEHVEDPIYYTAVFPEPRRIIPSQLRSHIRTIVLKGYLAYKNGKSETILLTSSPRSAKYTSHVLGDLKTSAELALKTKWKGIIQQKAWGEQIDPWWAYELVQAVEKTEILPDANLVRIETEYDRIMVNVVFKTIERLGRDVAQSRAILAEKQDPRLADAGLQSSKPLHYWSDLHRWGPDWPIGPDGEVNPRGKSPETRPIQPQDADVIEATETL